MEFLQSSWLWGIAAVTIPVIIHFWNQKKGKTIQWAASRWLLDKTTLNHRSIRLHEIPLMLIRCLLVTLLALILSKPLINWLTNSAPKQTIHLVQPEQTLVSNFRFELETALKKGEKVYWIGPEVRAADDLLNVPDCKECGAYMQQTINQLVGIGQNLRLYIHAGRSQANQVKIYVPGHFELYPFADSAGEKREPLQFLRDRKLTVLLRYRNNTEQKTVYAGLQALTDVYQIPFKIDMIANAGEKYDWILTDSVDNDINLQALYVLSGKNKRAELPGNVYQIPDSLRLSSSELVANGRLPEWMGDILLNHYNIGNDDMPLSNRQLKALFIQTKPIQETKADQILKWLLLMFVLTVLLERWMSLRKNTTTAYA
ncbi:BatA domain-containing protein [Dyadobacter arcticus]|uniref:Aerotolerance regulator N-terminal domain-containing protein n=1 Tax=Dyadobacter arcticus TaxID=1078754 RepID=A0ABX0UPW1_9BACT|nr:BatA domain-containing protein [Dyadobacter arcticus]NIJ55038.1 hypothetical protein [Dyadobacter arcticus]